MNSMEGLMKSRELIHEIISEITGGYFSNEIKQHMTVQHYKIG